MGRESLVWKTKVYVVTGHVLSSKTKIPKFTNMVFEKFLKPEFELISDSLKLYFQWSNSAY